MKARKHRTDSIPAAVTRRLPLWTLGLAGALTGCPVEIDPAPPVPPPEIDESSGACLAVLADIPDDPSRGAACAYFDGAACPLVSPLDAVCDGSTCRLESWRLPAGCGTGDAALDFGDHTGSDVISGQVVLFHSLTPDQCPTVQPAPDSCQGDPNNASDPNCYGRLQVEFTFGADGLLTAGEPQQASLSLAASEASLQGGGSAHPCKDVGVPPEVLRSENESQEIVSVNVVVERASGADGVNFQIVGDPILPETSSTESPFTYSVPRNRFLVLRIDGLPDEFESEWTGCRGDDPQICPLVAADATTVFARIQPKARSLRLEVFGVGKLTATATEGDVVLECSCESEVTCRTEPAVCEEAEIPVDTEFTFSVEQMGSGVFKAPSMLECAFDQEQVDCLGDGLNLTDNTVVTARFLEDPRTVRIESDLADGSFCGGAIRQVAPEVANPLQCSDGASMCERPYEIGNTITFEASPADPARDSLDSGGFSVEGWSLQECAIDEPTNCRPTAFRTCPEDVDDVESLRRCSFRPQSVVEETEFYRVGVSFGSAIQVAVTGEGQVSSVDPELTTSSTASISQICTHTATLTATPEAGWQLLQWIDTDDMAERPCRRPAVGDIECETRERCPIGFDEPGAIEAAFVQEQSLLLTVDRGLGRIVCAAAENQVPLCWEMNFQCEAGGGEPSACTVLTTQVLDCTAEPDLEFDSIFRRWSAGPCSGATEPTCATSIDELQPDLTAVFGYPVDVTIQNAMQNGGGGSVICNGGGCDSAYDAGATVLLRATPSGDAVFRRWQGDEACAEAGPECEITVDRARQVEAVFGYEFTIPEPAAGSGTLTVNAANGQADIVCTGGTCTVSADHGANITLTAVPRNGSAFSAWNGCTGTVQANECQVSNLQGPIPALSTDFTYSLTLVRPAAGSGQLSAPGLTCGANCARDVEAGTAVTVSRSALNGSQFRTFTGSCSGPSCSLTMDSNKTVGAIFTYRITLTRPPSGSGTLRNGGFNCGVLGSFCAIDRDAGTPQTVLALSSNGSQFQNFTNDCSGSTCSLFMDGNKTVGAAFTYDVLIRAVGGGFGTTTLSGAAGQPFTALANTSGDWVVNGFQCRCTGTSNCSCPSTSSADCDGPAAGEAFNVSLHDRCRIPTLTGNTTISIDFANEVLVRILNDGTLTASPADMNNQTSCVDNIAGIKSCYFRYRYATNPLVTYSSTLLLSPTDWNSCPNEPNATDDGVITLGSPFTFFYYGCRVRANTNYNTTTTGDNAYAVF